MGYKLQKSGEQIDAILLHSVVYLDGAFDSLANLQAAYPVGDDGLYRVGNKWYFWNSNAWSEGGDLDPNMVVKNQINVSIIQTTLKNINGKTLSSYESQETTVDSYPVFKITKGGVNLTKEDAATYMKYMCGSEYVPTYDYDFPRNTLFLLTNGQVLKPQFGSTHGLLLYKMNMLVFANRTIAGLPLNNDISVASLLDALFTVSDGTWDDDEQEVAFMVTIVNKKMGEYRGLSTDSKPVAQVSNGSTFFEMDTGKVYMFNEDSKSWVEIQEEQLWVSI